MTDVGYKEVLGRKQYFLERSSLYLYLTCGILLLGSIGYLIAVYIKASDQIFTVRGAGAVVAASIAVTGLVFLWRRREKSAIAAILFGMWMYATWIASYEGALHTVDLIVYPLIIIMMGWRLGIGYAFAIALLSVLACIAFYLMEVGSLMPAQLPLKPPEAALLVDVLVIVVSAATAKFLVHSYRDRLLEIAELTNDLAMQRDSLEEMVSFRTRELVKAKDAAEAANVAKSAFLANMSHELRTPMNGVLGMAYLVRRGGVTPKQAEQLDKLDAAGKHLVEVINAILDISKIESGKLCLERAEVRLDAITSDIASMMTPAAEAKNLQLLIENPPQPHGFIGDPTRLKQALLNLVGNAIKFTDQGHVILRVLVVEEGVHDALIRFEVEDSGIGIDSEVAGKLFHPFEQADNSSTRKYGGAGLGLAITKELAELMGGTAGVNSDLGIGSTFWFTARLRKT